MNYAFPAYPGKPTIAKRNNDGEWTASFSELKVTDNILFHLSNKFGDTYEFNPVIRITYTGPEKDDVMNSIGWNKKNLMLIKEFNSGYNHTHMIWKLNHENFGAFAPSRYQEGYERYLLDSWNEYSGKRVYPVFKAEIISPIYIALDDLIKSSK